MLRDFHSPGTWRRQKCLNPWNVEEEERENTFTFTQAKLVCPRTCRLLQSKKGWLGDNFVCLPVQISSVSPTPIPFKIKWDLLSSTCKTIFKQARARALKMGNSCKFQKNSVWVKLQILCSSLGSKHPHFSRHLNIFGLQNTSTCFFNVRSVYIFITPTKVSHVHYCRHQS